MAQEGAVEARGADGRAVASIPRRRRRASAAALATVGALLATGAVAGAAPTASELQAARELFAQAEKDEDAARWSDALEKLRRVAAYKLTAGVRYHLALCEEHLGQLATALADYEAAQHQAHEENAQDVLRLVGKQVAGLSARVPRLTIHVVPELPDEEVRLDGQPLAHATMGTAMGVDPGMHRIEATAPHRPTSTATVTLNERDATVLDVKLGEPDAIPAPAPASASAAAAPASAPASAAAPAASPPTPLAEAPSPPASRAGALALTASAILLAACGVAAFVVAGNSVPSGESACLGEGAVWSCDSQKNTVRTWDWIAAGAWAGAAVSGTFAVLLWTKPAHDTAPGASAHLLVGPASLGVGGRV